MEKNSRNAPASPRPSRCPACGSGGSAETTTGPDSATAASSPDGSTPRPRQVGVAGHGRRRVDDHALERGVGLGLDVDPRADRVAADQRVEVPRAHRRLARGDVGLRHDGERQALGGRRALQRAGQRHGGTGDADARGVLPRGEGGHHRRVDAEQEQHDQGADDERPALDPRRELAPRDERHGAQGAVHAAAPGTSDGAGVPVPATVSR